MTTPDPYPAEDPWHSAYDMLVPPPQGGLAALWQRLQETLRRSGALVMLIMLLTVALPQFAWSALTIVLGVQVAAGPNTPFGATQPGTVESGGAEPFGLLGLGLFLSVAGVVLYALFAALGWAAGVWAVTQTAAGRQVTLPEAFRGGVQWWRPMFGWFLLYQLMVTVGLLLCVLPGLYLAVAAGLFSMVVMFQRGTNPMAASFRMVHAAFGAVLGRFALLALFVLGVGCAVGSCAGLLLATGGTDAASPEPGDAVALRLLTEAVTQLVTVPLMTLVLVTVLLTYTQVRARWEPLSTATLRAALGPGPAPPGPATGAAPDGPPR